MSLNPILYSMSRPCYVVMTFWLFLLFSLLLQDSHSLSSCGNLFHMPFSILRGEKANLLLNSNDGTNRWIRNRGLRDK